MKTNTRQPGRDAAVWVIKRLRARGHRALLAGGCVRDMLLSIEPKDYDVVTDAGPDRVQEIFPRSRAVGARFGVILVRRHGLDIEVGTFRSDGDYSDGRRPDAVSFGSEREDALRRDFTINGLFLDPTDNRIIDYVGGQKDLQAGVLRAIGEPDLRFSEDHLRMLRAVRFAARFGLAIEPDTADAIGRHAASLRRISPERIWMELDMILSDPTRGSAWELIQSSGLDEYVIPGWSAPAEAKPIIAARMSSLPAERRPGVLGLSVILCGEAPHVVDAAARDLRLSNRERSTLTWLVGSLSLAQTAEPMELADLKTLMAGPAWSDLTDLLRADCLATGMPLRIHEQLRERASAIPLASIAPEPFITGDDLAAMGLSPGPTMGGVLKAIYRAQLNERLKDREAAKLLAVKLVDEADRPDPDP